MNQERMRPVAVVSFPGYSRCVEFPSGSETGGWMTGRASELQKTFLKFPKVSLCETE